MRTVQFFLLASWVRVNFLQRTLDDKQEFVSRDEKQKDDRNQARWRQGEQSGEKVEQVWKGWDRNAGATAAQQQAGTGSEWCCDWIWWINQPASPNHFGLDVCHWTVRTGLLFPERGSIRVLLLALSATSPRHDTAPPSGFDAFQAQTFGNGQESTSRAVHRRLVLPAAMAGVRCRYRCARRLPPRSRGGASASRSAA